MRMVFAPLACRDRQIRVAVRDRFSPVGFATQPGVELGNRVRSCMADAAFCQWDADANNADKYRQFSCHDSTTFFSSVGSVGLQRTSSACGPKSRVRALRGVDTYSMAGANTPNGREGTGPTEEGRVWLEGIAALLPAMSSISRRACEDRTQHPLTQINNLQRDVTPAPTQAPATLCARLPSMGLLTGHEKVGEAKHQVNGE